MPDYNPAVAAGIQVPQTNFAGTLGTVANIQAEQARTGLYTLQGLQQQREYNALQTAAQIGAQGGSRAEAYMRAGGQNPALISGFQQYDANQQFMATHGGNLPAAAEASANVALRGAETAKTEAERKKIIQDVVANSAKSLYADPSPENLQRVGKDLGWNDFHHGAISQLSPDQIKGIAVRHMAPGMSTEQLSTIVQPGVPAQATQPAQPPRLRPPEEVKGAEAAAVVPAELDKDLQMKGQGGIEAIQRLTRLKDAVNAASNANFGSMAGSETARQYQPIPSLAAEHDNLKSLYTDAGSAMLKARYGSRVTNMDVTQGMKIVGGTTVQNKATALKIIDNNMSEAYDAIWNGLKRGVVDPGALARPKSRQEADALGPGAVYIAPDGSPRRNAK